MGILAEWLSDLDVATFAEAYLGKKPCARAGTALRSCAVCTWQSLGRLLESRPSPDSLVVAKGKALDLPPPRGLDELRAQFAGGVGIVVRHPERQCSATRWLANTLGDDIPGEQRVLLFATPAASHGFSWHYDPEDVFIVQTAGDKEYYFRQNTVTPEPVPASNPDFSRYREEQSPMMSCRLLRGDFLYIPRGWWHMAHAHADSLSVSFGVFPALARQSPALGKAP